jgi:hypothetical protein
MMMIIIHNMREYYQLLSIFAVLSLYAQVTGSTHDKEAQ